MDFSLELQRLGDAEEHGPGDHGPRIPATEHDDAERDQALPGGHARVESADDAQDQDRSAERGRRRADDRGDVAHPPHVDPRRLDGARMLSRGATTTRTTCAGPGTRWRPRQRAPRRRRRRCGGTGSARIGRSPSSGISIGASTRTRVRARSRWAMNTVVVPPKASRSNRMPVMIWLSPRVTNRYPKSSPQPTPVPRAASSASVTEPLAR